MNNLKTALEVGNSISGMQLILVGKNKSPVSKNIVSIVFECLFYLMALISIIGIFQIPYQLLVDFTITDEFSIHAQLANSYVAALSIIIQCFLVTISLLFICLAYLLNRNRKKRKLISEVEIQTLQIKKRYDNLLQSYTVLNP